MANGITEFCCRSGGSNLNAGTLLGDSTEPGTSPSFIYESGNWDSSTGEFIVASGNQPAIIRSDDYDGNAIPMIYSQSSAYRVGKGFVQSLYGSGNRHLLLAQRDLQGFQGQQQAPV